MPDPKKLGDDLVVKLRPEFSRGFSDLWEVRDAFVAVCQELDAIAALVPGYSRKYIKIIDGTDSEL